MSNIQFAPSRCPECGNTDFVVKSFVETVYLDINRNIVGYQNKTVCFDYEAYECQSCQFQCLNLEQAEKWFSQYSRWMNHALDCRQMKGKM